MKIFFKIGARALTLSTTDEDRLLIHIPDIISFGAIGWIGGAVWAYLLNHALKITKGLSWECK